MTLCETCLFAVVRDETFGRARAYQHPGLASPILGAKISASTINTRGRDHPRPRRTTAMKPSHTRLLVAALLAVAAGPACGSAGGQSTRPSPQPVTEAQGEAA